MMMYIFGADRKQSRTNFQQDLGEFQDRKNLKRFYLGLDLRLRSPVSTSKVFFFREEMGPSANSVAPECLPKPFCERNGVCSTRSGSFLYDGSGERYFSHCSWVNEAFLRSCCSLKMSESSVWQSKSRQNFFSFFFDFFFFFIVFFYFQSACNPITCSQVIVDFVILCLATTE